MQGLRIQFWTRQAKETHFLLVGLQRQVVKNSSLLTNLTSLLRFLSVLALLSSFALLSYLLLIKMRPRDELLYNRLANYTIL